MHRRMSIGFFIFFSLLACTHVKPRPPQASSGTASAVPPTSEPVTRSTPAPGKTPSPSMASTPNGQPASAGHEPTGSRASTTVPAAEPPSTSATALSPAVKKPIAIAANPITPHDKSLSTKLLVDERTPPPADQASVAPTARPEPPALDLTALEQRLRDTHAIGVFSKLSLKNQVDDLLSRFRAFYSGQARMSLAELRQRYDLLLLKVLSLLQDGDPPLASAISASREAIWRILADREKFQKIQSG